MTTKNWRTVQEAQAHFGVSRQRIHQLIKKDVLGECKRIDTPIGHYWLIPYPFQRKELQTGRPKKDN